MSLSECTEKVRITSPNGNLLSEGETRCTDITTLRNLGYTIESLEEPKEPETIVNIPVENIEEIQVVDDVFIMQADLLINRSLELATVNVNLEAEKQQLTTQVQALQNTIEGLQTDVSKMPFENEKQYHEFLLQTEISKVHALLTTEKATVSIHPFKSGRDQYYSQWRNSVERSEIALEKFARDLGLNYTRRDIVNGENIYYNAYERSLDPIYRDDWVSYVPTSSAVNFGQKLKCLL